jgi:hypothetical protein
MSLAACHLVELPRVDAGNGSLSYLQTGDQFDFDVQRVYYQYALPRGARRGGHAHRELYQMIIAAAGGFEVTLDDGSQKSSVRLDRPDRALLVVPMIWVELHDYTEGSVSLVLASSRFDEQDYVRDYPEFRRLRATRAVA